MAKGKPKRADAGDGCLRRRTRPDGRGGRVEYGNYEIQLRDASGKIVSHNLGTSNKAEAKTKAKALTAEIRKGDNSITDGRVSVADYFQGWMEEKKRAALLGTIRATTLKRYSDCMVIFMKFLEKCRLSRLMVKDVNPEFFRRYQEWRIKQTRFDKKDGIAITAEGVNFNVGVLSMIFKAAYEDGLIPRKPTKGLKPLPTEDKRLELPAKEELEEIFLLVEDPAVIDYLTVVAAIGPRAVEAQQLKFKNVDWTRRTISIEFDPVTLWRPKNKRSQRKIPVSDEVMTIFWRIKERRGNVSPEDYIFIRANGLPLVKNNRYAYDQLTAAWKKANKLRRAAGKPELPRPSIRMLRHWAISWSINRVEAPMQAIQVAVFVGHSDLEMIQRVYFHQDIEGEGSQMIRRVPLFGRQLSLEAAAKRADGEGCSDADPATEVGSAEDGAPSPEATIGGVGDDDRPAPDSGAGVEPMEDEVPPTEEAGCEWNWLLASA